MKRVALLVLVTTVACSKAPSSGAPNESAPASSGAASGGAARGKHCADPTTCEQECNGGNGDSCYNAAAAYAEGKGVPADIPHATWLFEAGCKLKDAASCTNFGMRVDGSSDKDAAERSTAIFRQACDLKDPAGCGMLGMHLFAGRGIAKDEKAAVPLLQQGCDANVSFVCGYLAAAYQSGAGITADLARAQELYEKACTSSSWDDCRLAAKMYAARGDKEHARPLFDKACKNQIKAACDGLVALDAPKKSALQLCEEKGEWYTICDGRCVNEANDNSNCGACGRVPPAGMHCQGAMFYDKP